MISANKKAIFDEKIAFLFRTFFARSEACLRKVILQMDITKRHTPNPHR